jgi:hypothetical protein
MVTAALSAAPSRNPQHQERGDVMEKIRIEQHSVGGLLWVAGWLFTMGYLNLTFWTGVLALVLWPYYLGANVSALLR